MRKFAITTFLMLHVVVTPLLGAPPPGPDSGAGTATLQYDDGAMAGNILTPTRAPGGRRFGYQGGQGTISAAGQQLAIAARFTGKALLFGVDRNGDGTIAADEFGRFVKGGMVRVSLALPDRPKCAIQFTGLDIRPRGSSIDYMGGYYSISSCMAGTLNGQQVRLFDDNLDGRFTQDGQDAIAIGRTVVALPLGKTHQIGREICDLSVAKDGSSLQTTARTTVELGVVETPISPALLKSLILIGKGGVYDLNVSGKTGLPAGEYQLSYGILASGNQVITFLPPTQKRITYPITAGMINRLRIGPPAELAFSASVSGEQITVSPLMHVVGSGGEQYVLPAKALGQPRVLLAAGSRIVSQKSMEYG